MEKILWTCWTACSHLSFLILVTKVLLQLGMLLVLPHFISAGVLMVRQIELVYLLHICYIVLKDTWKMFFLNILW